jgi:biopolymer transport protein TolQ
VGPLAHPLFAQAAATEPEVKLNTLDLIFHAKGLEFAVFWLLLGMAVAAWALAILKVLQISRMRSGLHAFEKEVFNFVDAKDLFAVAQRSAGSPGARVVLALSRRGGSQKVLESIAKRAVVDEQQRAGRLMTLLASIASSAPFIGLLGTVYGIMEAFQQIGVQKSASLPVVAPAIGAALVATMVGLIAAIPALIFYNLLNRYADDFVSELESASEAWVTIVAESDQRLRVPADRTVPGMSQPPMHRGG